MTEDLRSEVRRRRGVTSWDPFTTPGRVAGDVRPDGVRLTLGPEEPRSETTEERSRHVNPRLTGDAREVSATRPGVRVEVGDVDPVTGRTPPDGPSEMKS